MSLHEDPLQTPSTLILTEQEEEEDTNEKMPKKTPITALLHATIDRFQRIRIPKKGTAEGGAVQLISGLDEVVFGTKGAADAVTICGIQPPRYAFFVMSGMFCDIIQLVLDMILHFIVGFEDASLCWFGGFVLSIIVRHTSHRYLVFGAHVGGYFYSLFRLYLGYSFSIALSTLFDFIVTRNSIQLSHYVAWTVTLLWTGAFNYFMLKVCWNVGKQKEGTNASVAEESSTNKEDEELVPLARTVSEDDSAV